MSAAPGAAVPREKSPSEESSPDEEFETGFDAAASGACPLPRTSGDRMVPPGPCCPRRISSPAALGTLGMYSLPAGTASAGAASASEIAAAGKSPFNVLQRLIAIGPATILGPLA